MNSPPVDMDTNYLKRSVEKRMTALIHRHIPAGIRCVADIGCGSGLYGEILAQKAEHVIGIDISPRLCEAARNTGCYREVFCDTLMRLPEMIPSADAVFCSEVLEHFTGKDLPSAVEAIHALSPRTLVFTVPNPWSPHYRDDPTHVARYTLASMKKTLNANPSFRYRLLPLGFADYNVDRSLICRWLNPLSSRVAILSPTVALVGDAL